MGRDAFLRGMRHYSETWRYRHPYPDDFFAAFQEGAGVDVALVLRGRLPRHGHGRLERARSSSGARRAPEGLFQAGPGRGVRAAEPGPSRAPRAARRTPSRRACPEVAPRRAEPRPWEARRAVVTRRGDAAPAARRRAALRGRHERARRSGRARSRAERLAEARARGAPRAGRGRARSRPALLAGRRPVGQPVVRRAPTRLAPLRWSERVLQPLAAPAALAGGDRRLSVDLETPVHDPRSVALHVPQGAAARARAHAAVAGRRRPVTACSRWPRPCPGARGFHERDRPPLRAGQPAAPASTRPSWFDHRETRTALEARDRRAGRRAGLAGRADGRLHGRRLAAGLPRSAPRGTRCGASSTAASRYFFRFLRVLVLTLLSLQLAGFVLYGAPWELLVDDLRAGHLRPRSELTSELPRAPARAGSRTGCSCWRRPLDPGVGRLHAHAPGAARRRLGAVGRRCAPGSRCSRHPVRTLRPMLLLWLAEAGRAVGRAGSGRASSTRASSSPRDWVAAAAAAAVGQARAAPGAASCAARATRPRWRSRAGWCARRAAPTRGRSRRRPRRAAVPASAATSTPSRSERAGWRADEDDRPLARQQRLQHLVRLAVAELLDARLEVVQHAPRLLAAGSAASSVAQVRGRAGTRSRSRPGARPARPRARRPTAPAAGRAAAGGRRRAWRVGWCAEVLDLDAACARAARAPPARRQRSSTSRAGGHGDGVAAAGQAALDPRVLLPGRARPPAVAPARRSGARPASSAGCRPLDAHVAAVARSGGGSRPAARRRCRAG